MQYVVFELSEFKFHTKSKIYLSVMQRMNSQNVLPTLFARQMEQQEDNNARRVCESLRNKFRESLSLALEEISVRKYIFLLKFADDSGVRNCSATKNHTSVFSAWSFLDSMNTALRSKKLLAFKLVQTQLAKY